MIDDRLYGIAFGKGFFFSHAYVGGFGIRIGHGRNCVVVGPAPLGRFRIGKEVIGQDFRFLVGFVPKGRFAVDVANGKDSVGCCFQKFIRFDIAAWIDGDVGVF